MASTYSWRINKQKMVYLIDEDKQLPFIYNKTDNSKLFYDNTLSYGSVDRDAILKEINKLNVYEYYVAFKRMLILLSTDKDANDLALYDFSYYFNIDNYKNAELEQIKFLDTECNIIDLYEDDDSYVTVRIKRINEDRDKVYSFDFGMPRGRSAMYCFLTPQFTNNTNIIYDNITKQKVTEQIEIFLYKGNVRLVPDSIIIEKDEHASADIITKSGTYTYKYVPDMSIGNTHTREIRFKIKYVDKDNSNLVYNKTLMYRFNPLGEDLDNTGSVKEINGYITKLKNSYDEYSRTLIDTSGETVTELKQTAEEISLTTKSLDESTKTLVKVNSDSIIMAAEDTINSASTIVVDSPSGITQIVIDKIKNVKSEFIQNSDSIVKKVTDYDRQKSAEITKTVSETEKTFEDTYNNLKSSFKETASEYKSTIENGSKDACSSMRRSAEGFHSVVATSGKVVSDFEQKADEFKGKISTETAMGIINQCAKEISANFSNISGYSSTVKVKADEIDRKVSGFTESGETRLSEMKLKADSINMGISDTEEVLSNIHVDAKGIIFTSDRLRMEGVVTANGGFAIDKDGSVTVNNADITGYLVSNVTIIDDYIFCPDIASVNYLDLSPSKSDYQVLLPLDPEYIGYTIDIVGDQLGIASKYNGKTIYGTKEFSPYTYTISNGCIFNKHAYYGSEIDEEEVLDVYTGNTSGDTEEALLATGNYITYSANSLHTETKYYFENIEAHKIRGVEPQIGFSNKGGSSVYYLYRSEVKYNGNDTYSADGHVEIVLAYDSKGNIKKRYHNIENKNLVSLFSIPSGKKLYISKYKIKHDANYDLVPIANEKGILYTAPVLIDTNTGKEYEDYSLFVWGNDGLYYNKEDVTNHTRPVLDDLYIECYNNYKEAETKSIDYFKVELPEWVVKYND